MLVSYLFAKESLLMNPDLEGRGVMGAIRGGKFGRFPVVSLLSDLGPQSGLPNEV